MARIHHSAASLRIIGDELIPAEVTEALGASPTHEQTKGEKMVGKNTGKVRTARFGMWRLQVSHREPEDLDGQIREILGQLTEDLDVWKSISSRYKMDLFCGLFMGGSNEGMVLSPESPLALGSRGIKIGLDLYGPTCEDEKSTSDLRASLHLQDFPEIVFPAPSKTAK